MIIQTFREWLNVEKENLTKFKCKKVDLASPWAYAYIVSNRHEDANKWLDLEVS